VLVIKVFKMARKRKRNNNKNNFSAKEEDEYITFDEDKRR